MGKLRLAIRSRGREINDTPIPRIVSDTQDVRILADECDRSIETSAYRMTRWNSRRRRSASVMITREVSHGRRTWRRDAHAIAPGMRLPIALNIQELHLLKSAAPAQPDGCGSKLPLFPIIQSILWNIRDFPLTDASQIDRNRVCRTISLSGRNRSPRKNMCILLKRQVLSLFLVFFSSVLKIPQPRGP